VVGWEPAIFTAFIICAVSTALLRDRFNAFAQLTNVQARSNLAVNNIFMETI